VAKSYRPVQREQVLLLPPDMSEWLPPDHLVWFVLDVVDGLDTTSLEQCRRVGGAGAAGYDPRMLLALLVYAYCCGVRSSRQIERLCTTDVAFRVLLLKMCQTTARLPGSTATARTCSKSFSLRCC
jgi:transposase